MSDTEHPDLSLPAKAPSMARYHDEPMTLHPTTLYTLVDLTDAELGELERECEGACLELGSDPGDSVRLAPQPRFVGQSLRAVFDCHLERLERLDELGKRDTLDFEPRYFIVAVDREWRSKGVILVTVDDDELECNVDSFRMKAFDVGLVVGGLQVYNSSWEEQKASYELHPDNGDGDDGDGSDHKTDHDGDGDPEPGSPTPTKNSPLGYYIPIYIHSSLSEEKVVADLEPAFKLKSPEEYGCRVQAKLTPTSSASASASGGPPSSAQTQELIQQAAALHPTRCAKNRFLHKTHILIIDTPDPVEYGMLMLELPPWDASPTAPGKADLDRAGKEPAALALAASEPQPQQHKQPIRIPYHCHDGLQTRFLILANGDADWPSEAVRAQPVFLVFQYHTHGKDLGFGARSMDPGAARRKPGEERLVYVAPGEGHEGIEWGYGEAVRQFPWFCREKRFVEGLDTTFFVCVDGDDVAETGPLLVRRSWDGNVWGRTRDELLGLPVDGVKVVRVTIKETIATLEKGRKSETDGMSESLTKFFL